MSENSVMEQPPAFKPKKSVALSGTPAGNTALCSVGRSGNDLHYRGYDILDFATTCDFEEIAYLLVHGKLPNPAELAAYKWKLKNLRGIPSEVKAVLERLPAAAHPMDVMRTAVSALGCVLPEKDDHHPAGARDIADRLMACLGSMLLYWYHFSTNGRRIEVETDDESIGGHFLHLLHGGAPSQEWVRAMHTSLILYAEHEFNASTFTARVIAGTGSDIFSCIAGAIGALSVTDNVTIPVIGIGAGVLAPISEADHGDLADPDAAKSVARQAAIDKLRDKFGPKVIGKGRGI